MVMVDGQPENRKMIRTSSVQVPCTEPMVLTADTHEVIQYFASDSMDLMTKGYITQTIQEALIQVTQDKNNLPTRKIQCA